MAQQEERSHAVYVRLRPELMAKLERVQRDHKEWPTMLHSALAREFGLPESVWPARPVGRPPNGKR